MNANVGMLKRDRRAPLLLLVKSVVHLKIYAVKNGYSVCYMYLISSLAPSPVVCVQLTELGVANSLVAIDIDDMVRKAVHLATNSALRENISASIIARKGVLSNPHRASNEWENFLERAVRSTVHRGSPS